MVKSDRRSAGKRAWTLLLAGGLLVPLAGAVVAENLSTGEDPVQGDDTASLDLQVRAIEVTQGVRGAIPERGLDDPLLLPGDRFTHVAERRTVVRVYLLVEGLAVDHVLPPVAARLEGTREGRPLAGSPLAPVQARLTLLPEPALDEQRANAGHSWNFVLPRAWTRQGGITLTAEIDPDARLVQCQGCRDNDEATLQNVWFQPVLGPEAAQALWRIDPLLVSTTVANESTPAPSERAIPSVLEDLRRLLPVATDPWRVGLPRLVAWEARDGGPGLAESLLRLELSSSTPGTQNRGWIVPALVASTDGCPVEAYLDHPLVIAAPCAHPSPTVVHGVLHSFGLGNAGEAHNASEQGLVDRAFPDAHGALTPSTFGFDVLRLQAIPASRGDNHTHDLMALGEGVPWVSLRTWEQARTALLLRPASVASPPPNGSRVAQAVLLTGEVTPTGEARLSPAFLVTEPAARAVRQPARDAPPLELRFLDAEGRALGQTTAPELVPADGLDSPRVFHHWGVLPPGTAAVALFEEDRELTRANRTPGTPNVTLVEPAPSTAWSGGSPVTVRWTAEDPDDDALTYALEASPDGERWTFLAMDLTEPTVTIEPRWLEGPAGTWQVRVQASDGLGIGTSAPVEVELAPRAPFALIERPAHGAWVAAGRPLVLQGTATDPQDGALSGGALTWLLDGRTVASGEEATLTELVPGEHVLTLQARNGAGLTGETTALVRVAEDADGDGLPDAWERDFGLDPTLGWDAALDSDGDGLPAWLEAELGTDPARADTDDDGFDDGLEATRGGAPAAPARGPGPLHGLAPPAPRPAELPGPLDGAQVTNEPEPPTARFTFRVNGLSVTVDGSSSRAPEGDVELHAWDWGDESPPDRGATAKHTYAAPGSYTVTLVVVAPSGETDGFQQTVRVSAPASPEEADPDEGGAQATSSWLLLLAALALAGLLWRRR